MGLPFDAVVFGSKEWTSHRQRCHWVVEELAALGASVLFVENLGIRSPGARDARRVVTKLRHWMATSAWPDWAPAHPGVVVDAPIVLPVQQRTLLRRPTAAVLTRRLQRRLTTDRDLVVWTYLPLPVVRDVKARLGASLLVYDWADDSAAHALTRSAAHRRRLATWEDEMAAEADVTYFSSGELLRRRGGVCRRAVLIPHGVRQAPAGTGRVPPAAAALPSPRVGFVGSITEFTDLELLAATAEARPDWSFVLAGPARVSLRRFRSLANVTVTGELSHDDVIALLGTLDATVVPYRLTAATEVSSPLKVREYIAHGLPVVSVDIPEVRDVPGVTVASGADEFVAALDRVLSTGRSAPGTLMPSETWSERVGAMVDVVVATLDERAAGYA